MKSIIRFLDLTLFKLVSFCAQLLLLSAVITGLYQVFTRFVLQAPSAWTEAWTRSSLIWVVFLGLILAFRHGEMLKVDVLNTILPPKGRRIIFHFANFMCAAFLGFLTWIGIDMTYRVRFQNIAGLEFSISWIYAAIPIGSALALIAVLVYWFNPEVPENQHLGE